MQMTTRTFLLLACAIMAAACSDSSPALQEPVDSVPGASVAIASEPMTVVPEPGSLVMQGAAARVSYVSLPAGTLSQAVSARIRNVTSNGTVSEPIVVCEGGFDPVPISAAANDELEIAVTDSSRAVTLLRTTVPTKRPPSIVRTNPPKGRTAVSLKVVPTIVFSEPIDAQSLAGEVQLESGGTAIIASVNVAASAPWVVEVVPASVLQPLTTYQLTIRPGVRDLDGDALQTTETVEFTTGPALQFSGRVAFVSTRDGSENIYLANGDGSGVVRLTSGSKPSWSPDGRRIVFERAGIRLINADGSGDTRLVAGRDPAWSPDGNRIAFVDNEGISVINIDGSGLTQLIRHDINLRGTSGTSGYVGAPAWSPDGTRIAFEYANEWDDFPQRIYVMNADGSQPRLLTGSSANPFQAAECNPSWSPDGSSIVLWNYIVGVAVTDASGAGAMQRLFNGPNLSCHSAPDWSRDGAAAVFTHPRGGQFVGRIYVVPRGQAGTAHQLIPDVVAPANPTYVDYDAVWSR